MSMPFDATLKHLLQEYPHDWLRIAGLKAEGPIEVVDANLSTITAEADKLLRIDDPTPWLLHLEAQASLDMTLPSRVAWYNSLAHQRHALLVRSVVVLLRRAASGRTINGVYRLKFDDEKRPYLDFRYRVVRVWELAADEILENGLGTLPLALLTDDAAARMGDVLDQMMDRVTREASGAIASTLLTAAYVLSGLRYPTDVANVLFRGVKTMEESATYQFILQQGMAKGAAIGLKEGRKEGERLGKIESLREVILLQGTHKFGQPPELISETLEEIDDYDRLLEISKRILSASNWNELLP